MAGQVALGTVQHGLPSLGPALRSSLDLSLSQVGVVFSGVVFGTSATLMAWGWIADRVGERRAIGTGLFTGAVALHKALGGGWSAGEAIAPSVAEASAAAEADAPTADR